jgi:tRNA G18 (ribose-2'-O)-methylase SpoU
VTDARLTLVGDGIENPHNALAMTEIATALHAGCVFLDRKQLQIACHLANPDANPVPCIAGSSLTEEYCPIIACDTLLEAVDLFGCRPAPGERPAVVVGNERLGLTHAVQTQARQKVRIPMAERGIGSLNVAAAAAIVLYFLGRGGGPMQTRRNPAAHRPDILLLGPNDHAELGCAVRSAAAFGWGRVLIEDRAGVWFGVDRQRRAEGRAAARQSKNSIMIVRVEPERRYAYDEVVIIRSAPVPGSIPLARVNVARGARQLVVFPDQAVIEINLEEWSRYSRVVRIAHLGFLDHPTVPRYRAVTGIALAEVARQVGRTSSQAGPRPARGPRYERALELIRESEDGEEISFAELLTY